MNLHLKIFIAASSAALVTMAAALQGCSSNDDSEGSADTAGTSGATTTTGATSAAGTDASGAGTAAGGAGASSVAGSDTGGGGATAGGGGATAGGGDATAGGGDATAGGGSATAGGGGAAAGGGGATATTFTLQTTTLGQVLATAAGKTLYIYKSDTPSTSAPVGACDSNCQSTWPVYYGNPVSVPDGLAATDFNSFTNGTAMQSTYKGWPLYTYAADQNAGDVIGDESISSGSWLAVKIPFAAPN